MSLATTVSVWFNAFFIIASISILFKETHLFRFAEYTMIGAAAGHLVLMGLVSINSLGIRGIREGNIFYAVAFILGALLMARYYKPTAWLIRYGMAFIVGSTVSMTIRGAIMVDVVNQIRGGMMQIFVPGSLYDTINNLIILAFTLTVIAYFIYNKAYGTTTTTYDYIIKFARIAIMIYIGNSLSFGIMTRNSYLINRFQYILFSWLGL
jgi:hypothetical protein